MAYKTTGLSLLTTKYNSSGPERMVEFQPNIGSAGWLFWGIWVMALVLVFSVFLAIIDVAPFLHIDEFMTIDLGRVIFNPESKWSIAWMAERERPAFVIFYIGPVLQELAYELGGQYGPRISGILGATLAATVMVKWLLARCVSRKAVFLLGLVFLLDPIFVQAYTIGRVDGWAMAACLASCWVLRTSKYFKEESYAFRKQIVFAGMLAAFAFFIWPSVVFIFPLLLLELSILVKGILRRMDRSAWKANLLPFVLFGTSGLVTTIVLLIPISSQVYGFFYNVVEGLVINTKSGPSGETSFNLRDNLGSLIHLFQVLKFSPVLLLIAILGVINRHDLKLLIAGLFATILMLCTLVYSHRIQYLLPYFIVAAAGLYELKEKQSLNPNNLLIKTGGLVILLIWSVGLSIVARTVLAFTYREELDRGKVFQAARKMIGPGHHAVYSHTFEFYYEGRSLGWRMYKPYLVVGDNPFIKEGGLRQIFSQVDYSILQQQQLTKEVQQQLHEAGMLNQGTFRLYDKPVGENKGGVTNLDRVRDFYFMYRQPYGPYILYAREKDFKGNQVSLGSKQQVLQGFR